jgi:hypothetical protein
MTAYDAVLGYDWLKTHSPMVCHWELKTLEFSERGQQVHLEGVTSVQKTVLAISLDQVVKLHKGNDIWAMAMVHQAEEQASVLPPLEVVQVVLT